jgi:hypothetical protein
MLMFVFYFIVISRLEGITSQKALTLIVTAMGSCNLNFIKFINIYKIHKNMNTTYFGVHSAS